MPLDYNLGTTLASSQAMASYPRYMIVENGSTFHVTQYHNRDWLLKDDHPPSKRTMLSCIDQQMIRPVLVDLWEVLRKDV